MLLRFNNIKVFESQHKNRAVFRLKDYYVTAVIRFYLMVIRGKV